MGESTESSTERSPFTKPGFIILAALVIALLAGVVMIFLLPKGDRTTQRGRTQKRRAEARTGKEIRAPTPHGRRI